MKLEVIAQGSPTAAHPTPLLFVHGMWHGAWCWTDHFLPYLAARGYAAHAVNLRGHCGSEGQRRLRWNTLADYVDDMAQVAAGLPRAPVLVGHSMGGLLAQKYVAVHPAAAAVLLASVPPVGLIPATVRFARRHPAEFVRVLVTWRTYPVVGTPALVHEMMLSPGTPPEIVAACHSRLQDEAFRAYVGMLFGFLDRPRRDRVPVLVLGGSRDATIAPHEVKATARAYGTRPEFFDMGHDMMIEPGWQSVADCILAWLAERGL